MFGVLTELRRYAADGPRRELAADVVWDPHERFSRGFEWRPHSAPNDVLRHAHILIQPFVTKMSDILTQRAGHGPADKPGGTADIWGTTGEMRNQKRRMAQPQGRMIHETGTHTAGHGKRAATGQQQRQQRARTRAARGSSGRTPAAQLQLQRTKEARKDAWKSTA